jgi:sulfoxide reductase catalytic subunit YedY
MHHLRDRRYAHPLASDITSREVYEGRRTWLKAAALSAGAGAGLWAQQQAHAQTAAPGKLTALAATRSSVPGAMTLDKPSSYADASTYNNYYEFGTDKAEPAKRAFSLKPRPWTLAIEGEVKKPRVFGLEDLLTLSAQEERIYRLRCVEGWSMVVPWIGYSLSELIKRVEPTGKAKFIQFITLADKQQMPGLSSSVLDWPYAEGLRMDEAMHPLTLLTFGMYGEVLPNQNGAPLRIIVPWKYGFKSGKSIVKIRFLPEQPATSWSKAAPREYGFYANVNPSVAHPRWSQASERRIGEDGLFQRKRPTQMFNGYEAQVGSLYAGMDLSRYY